MAEYYADIRNVSEALQERVGPGNEQGRLQVLDKQTKIVGLDREEMDKRNLLNTAKTHEYICAIRWHGADRGMGPVTLEFHFHENELDSTFMFTSTGGNYTRLAELSERLGIIEMQVTGLNSSRLNVDCSEYPEDEVLTNTLGLPRPDFAEIDSASMNAGFKDGLASREFKYEVLAELADFRD